jgi:hypothetical protein
MLGLHNHHPVSDPVKDEYVHLVEWEMHKSMQVDKSERKK